MSKIKKALDMLERLLGGRIRPEVARHLRREENRELLYAKRRRKGYRR